MARWMAPSGGIRLLLWREKKMQKRNKKRSVLECEGSNHKVLFFKWHYLSMEYKCLEICEGSFDLLEKLHEMQERLN